MRFVCLKRLHLTQKTIWLTLWIGFNLWLPTYMFAFILILVIPTSWTAIWGLILLMKAPPLGLVLLLNAAFYSWLLYVLARLLSIWICYFSQVWVRAVLLVLVLLCSLIVTFEPIYGSGSGWGSGSFPGKTFWSLLVERF